MKYGVVIVTYNRLELLKECVEACLNQTLPFDKIIVIDNCSTDGTDQYLSTFSNNQTFDIFRQPENKGGAGGFYEGLKHAQDDDIDYILLIDDDAIIDADFVEECDRVISENKDLAACSGTVYTNGKIQLIARRVLVSSIFYLGKNIPESEYSKSTFRYDFSTFCGLMVKKDVVKEIGLPKENYFIWYDDAEYSMRLKKYGGIINANNAKLNHKTNIPQGGIKNFFTSMNWKNYYGNRNRIDAVKCHFNSITTLFVILQCFVYIIVGFLMQIFPKSRKQGRYIDRLIWAAIKDGLKGKLGKNENFLPC